MESSPVRQVLRVYVVHNLFVQFLFLLASLSAMVFYIADTYERLPAMHTLRVFFLTVFVAELTCDVLSKSHPLRFLLSPVSLGGLLSLLPYLLAVVGSPVAYLLDCLLFLRLQKVAYFCKMLQTLRIVRSRDYLTEAKHLSRLRALAAGISELSIQITVLVVNILGFLAFSATLMYSIFLSDPAAFHQPSGRVDWMEFFYFAVVTVTTVGYGDIYATSNKSRMIVMLMIIVGFTFIPVQLSFVAQSLLFGEKSKSYILQEPSVDYICVVGIADFSFVKGLLLEVFHHSHRTSHSKKLKLVFLSPFPLDDSIIALLRIPQFKYSVEYHVGSGKNPLDLHRLGVERALAILILREKRDVTLADEEVIHKLLHFKIINCSRTRYSSAASASPGILMPGCK